MREIKHRGITTDGEMIFGSLVVTTNFLKSKPKSHTRTWIIESSFSNGGWFSVLRKRYVKPETVGQYTGTKDSDEIDIFEGDILTFDWRLQDNGELYTSDCKDIKGVVNWIGGKFVVFFFNNSMHFDLSDINQSTFERFWSQKYVSSTDYFKMTDFKIIGNIHQNPELLK